MPAPTSARPTHPTRPKAAASRPRRLPSTRRRSGSSTPRSRWWPPSRERPSAPGSDWRWRATSGSWASDGWFQANFVRLGIHPGFALSLVLPDVIGPGRAAELFLTGRRVGAAEAVAVGLAHRAVASGDEVGAAMEMAQEIAAGAPLAVAATRATLRHGLGAAVRAAMRHELAEQTALAGTADAVEGVSAMLEGRTPRFEGR